MVFPSLDGSFSCILAMVVRRDALEGDFVFLESFFELVGALVVEEVQLGRTAAGLKLPTQLGPGFGELASLATFEGRGESGVGVAVAEDHDTIVAARQLDRELACLVGARFFELVCAFVLWFLGRAEIE